MPGHFDQLGDGVDIARCAGPCSGELQFGPTLTLRVIDVDPPQARRDLFVRRSGNAREHIPWDRPFEERGVDEVGRACRKRIGGEHRSHLRRTTEEDAERPADVRLQSGLKSGLDFDLLVVGMKHDVAAIDVGADGVEPTMFTQMRVAQTLVGSAAGGLSRVIRQRMGRPSNWCFSAPATCSAKLIRTIQIMT